MRTSPQLTSPMKQLLDKLTSRGSASLDDTELLTLLLGEGGEQAAARRLAERLLEYYDGALARLGRDPLPRLRMVEGMGQRRAARIAAAAELGRRILQAQAAETTTLVTSDDVIRLFRPELEQLDHEECWAVYLSSSNRIIERQRISQGGVQGTVVDHRLIVKRALELLATQLILVHNHPSGSAEASEPDRMLTARIAQAAALFDIRLQFLVPVDRTALKRRRTKSPLPSAERLRVSSISIAGNARRSDIPVRTGRDPSPTSPLRRDA